MSSYNYSSTPASNTSLDGVAVASSSSPQNADNAFRELASNLHDDFVNVWGGVSVGGTADAITITLSGATVSTAFSGMAVGFIAGSDNTTTSPTVNISSIGAEPIKKASASGTETALAASDISSGGMYLLIWRSAWDSSNGAWMLVDLNHKQSDLVTDTTPQLGGDLDLNGNNIDFPTTANISDCLDEDDMASDSATVLATQQSIKAYVDTNAAGDCIFIASSDASNDSVLNFTGFSASTYDAYLFVLSNIVPATDSVELWFRTSTNGGSTYDSSGYGWAVVAHQAGTGTFDDSDASDAAINLSGVRTIGSAAGEDGYSGRVMVLGPHLAKKTIVEFNGGVFNTSGAFISFNGSGARLSSADVDACQFLFSSGNIESGTITMYGLKNA